MKKLLTIIGTAVLMQFQSFGHAWTVTRSWCGGFFNRKFEAHAEVSSYNYITYATGFNCLGQWVGYQAYYNPWTVCSNEDKGCTRPRVADCNNSGNSYDYTYTNCALTNVAPAWGYWGHARASYQIGSITITQDRSGRGYAGWQDAAWVNPDIAASLVTDGLSHGDITGEVSVTDDHLLRVENLTGTVTIASGQDLYSKVRILVVKENESITDDEAMHRDELAKQGVFENVVYSSEIIVTKGSMTADGIFSGLPAGKLTDISNDESTGYSLNNISLSHTIDASLEPGEHLTVITIVDGGVDISSAIVPGADGRPAAAQPVAGAIPTEIYPNPAVNTVNCKLFAASDNETITVKAFDITGKEIGTIYSGTSVKGYNVIENIDVSGLPQGVQVLETNVGGITERKKITITR